MVLHWRLDPHGHDFEERKAKHASMPTMCLRLEDYLKLMSNKRNGDGERLMDESHVNQATERLSLDDFHRSYGSRFFPLWDMLARLPHLQELYFRMAYGQPERDENRLHIEGFSRIVANVNHLQVLFLDVEYRYSWDDLQQQFPQSLQSVKDLRLEGPTFDSGDWAGFAETLSRLGVERLYLANPELSADPDRHFERFLALDTCKLVDLHVCGIAESDIGFWMRAVRTLERKTSLIKIYLSCCGTETPPSPASRGFARVVSSLLKANASGVEEVVLSNVLMDKRPCKRMSAALRDNRTLKSLKLCNCAIRRAPSLQVLASALATHPTLETLEISDNYPPLSPDAIIDFVSSLSENHSLKRLVYKSGGGTEEKFSLAQVMVLLKALERNFCLEELDLPIWYQCSEDLAKECVVMLCLNAAGRRYIVDGDTKGLKAGVAVLCAVSDDLDCLFYHLRENPLICNSTALKESARER